MRNNNNVPEEVPVPEGPRQVPIKQELLANYQNGVRQHDNTIGIIVRLTRDIDQRESEIARAKGELREQLRLQAELNTGLNSLVKDMKEDCRLDLSVNWVFRPEYGAFVEAEPEVN